MKYILKHVPPLTDLNDLARGQQSVILYASKDTDNSGFKYVEFIMNDIQRNPEGLEAYTICLHQRMGTHELRTFEGTVDFTTSTGVVEEV